jgi:hypothetical protein
MSIADQAVQQLDRLGAIILDDVGDGPRTEDLAAAARAAREAISGLAVPALTQLGGLIAGVADSIASGATEWNPSLGGTLMAAIDDLRHLAGRPTQFSDEDSEHLHHRASELSPYVRAPQLAAAGPAPTAPPAAAVDDRAETPAVPPQAPIIPISDLFYADAGPHIISGGMPTAAKEKSDILGRGIDALDNLTMKPIAKQVTFASTEVIPVETLLYRGRAALERAAALREQIKIAGGVASPATLDEMYDLIGLALKD